MRIIIWPWKLAGLWYKISPRNVFEKNPKGFQTYCIFRVIQLKLRKLCLFAKFPYQKIGWNYGIVRVLFYLVTPILVVSLISSDPVPHRIIKGSRVDSNHLWLIPFLMLVIPFSGYFYLKHKNFHLLEASYISTGTEIIILRGRHPKVLYLEYRKFTYSKILS